MSARHWQVTLLYALAVMCLGSAVPALMRGDVPPVVFLLAAPLTLVAGHLWTKGNRP